MQLTNAVITAILAASTAFAAPAPAKSMMAASPQWTIENMKRVCNKANTSCTWTFGINNKVDKVTGCTHVVNKANAAQANGGPTNCGVYTVTSGWSGQFGPGNGFTTLAVVDNKKRQIVYPAYTDKAVASGAVVKPDLSFAPQGLP